MWFRQMNCLHPGAPWRCRRVIAVLCFFGSGQIAARRWRVRPAITNAKKRRESLQEFWLFQMLKSRRRTRSSARGKQSAKNQRGVAGGPEFYPALVRFSREPWTCRLVDITYFDGAYEAKFGIGWGTTPHAIYKKIRPGQNRLAGNGIISAHIGSQITGA